ncbi:MAG: TadE/TadG family type IV pilus assembly protein [Mycobacteriales bacterium]
MSTGHRDEVGSFTLELAVLAPALLLLLAFVVAAGRVELAGGAIDAAARDSARAASLARTAPAAEAAALATARDFLASQHFDCRSLAVTVDTGGFSAPLGTPAAVQVHLSCDVPLTDVALPGLPGSKTLQATFSSPLDPYRSR